MIVDGLESGMRQLGLTLPFPIRMATTTKHTVAELQ
jgi:hypothetical protein